MDLVVLIVIAVIALVVASVSIVAGLGGGILLIPILTLFFGLNMRDIVGAILVSITIPAIIGTYGAWKRHEINFKIGLLFEIPTAIGAYIGARNTSMIAENTLRLIFAIIAMVFSVQMIDRSIRTKKNLPKRKSYVWMAIAKIPPVVSIQHRTSTSDEEYKVSISSLFFGGLIVGFLAGLLGMGGGWIKTPMLMLAFGLPAIIATGTAIFMITITATVGGFTHLLYDSIDIQLLYALVGGLGIGAIIGNHMKPKLKNYQITMLIGGLLFIVALLMLRNVLMAA